MSKFKNWLDAPLTWRRYYKTQFTMSVIGGLIAGGAVACCVLAYKKSEKEGVNPEVIESDEIEPEEYEE